MVLPVLRDKYAENLRAAEARGMEEGMTKALVAKGVEEGVAREMARKTLAGEMEEDIARGLVRGLEKDIARCLTKAEARGERIGLARAKRWHERKQRAEQNGEPFTEPTPWEK